MDSLQQYVETRMTKEHIDPKCSDRINIHSLHDIPDQTSDGQIKYLIDLIQNNNLTEEYSALIQIFTSFLDIGEAVNFYKIVRKEGMNDTKALATLKHFMNKNKKKKTRDYYDSECNSRNFTFKSIGRVLEDLKIKTNTKYLDVGCGDGKKTTIFARILGINEYLIHGIDVESWGPYEKHRKFKWEYKNIKNEIYPYDNESFGIVSMMLTLHHIKNVDQSITEMYRVLKHGGVLIIIEHDIVDGLDKLVVDIQHSVFGVIFDKRPDYIKNPAFSKYRNRYELEYMFIQKGFEHLHTQFCYSSVKATIRYDRQIFQIYRKR